VLNSRVFRTTSFRLSALYGGVFALGFGTLLLITYLTATKALREQIRAEVQSDLHALTVEAGADGVDTIIQDIKERIQPVSGSTAYYFLADAKGKKLAGNLDGIAIIDGWQEMPLDPTSTAKQENSADGDHQVWGQGIHLDDGSFLFTGQDAYRVLTAQEAIINSFAWSVGISFLFAALAGTLLSRSFLRRIDAINTTSLAIIDGNLKERIPVRGTSDEIDLLSKNLNRLLDSNHALLESLKQVSNSIAHDLRTPLSRLRQGLEEAHQRNDPSALRATLEAAMNEADQLLGTFSALLRIAQIESGSRRAGFKQLSLTTTFQQVADAYRPVAEDQQKYMTVSLAPDVMIYGDRDLLMQMLVNLLENALHHTGAGTAIMLSLQNGEAGPVAIIADSGPGIAESDRERVFERFYRIDRSRSSPGNGLGLSLVSAIASLHGIRVELQDNAPGLRVVFNFPAPA
jgi:signal transduction histidine kinase